MYRFSLLVFIILTGLQPVTGQEKRALIIGIDKYTLGEVNRISPEAPVPVVEVVKEWMKLGLAANVSDNLQSLEVKSTICGVIGHDSNGNLLEHLLEDTGIKTWGLVRDEKRMTTFKERIVTSVQQICRVDYETKSTIDAQTFGRILNRLEEFQEGHSALIIEDYAKGLLTEELCQKAIKLFKEHKKIVAVDPSRTTPPLWYKGASLLKPNRAEATMMAKSLGFDTKNVEDIAKILVDKLQLEKIVITLGPEGMAMLDTKLDGTLHHIPTVASEVFDVSGAGDTAISAIVTALLTGASLEEAAWVGNCASGVVVGKKGTALVTKTELLHFYQHLKDKI